MHSFLGCAGYAPGVVLGLAFIFRNVFMMIPSCMFGGTQASISRHKIDGIIAYSPGFCDLDGTGRWWDNELIWFCFILS